MFLVPDGGLHQIDFGALPAKGGSYLVEHGPEVHILTSGRDLVRLTSLPAPPAGRGLLALGAPDFEAARAEVVRTAGAPRVAYGGATPECGGLSDSTWRPLPESRREVERIGQLFEGRESVVTLTGRDASEERFKREVVGKRILHLATHAFFLHEKCAATGVDKSTSGTPVRENPLLLSGLVLAGANHIGSDRSPGEDGVITAEELATLDLSSLETAVFSGCDTGRGESVTGEGVLGLRRALEIAGVDTVVMSLWPVPDRSARRWMTTFYQKRLAGESVSGSARSAGLATLNALREAELPTHPYLWAGFVTAGDWR